MNDIATQSINYDSKTITDNHLRDVPLCAFSARN
jgi:hypothetical protein